MDQQLRDFIIDSGLVSRADVLEAEREARMLGQSLGRILVQRSLLSEDDLRKMQSHLLGIVFVDLREEKLPFEILSMIPEPVSRNHNVIAFDRTDSSLEVALLDMEDLATLGFLKEKFSLKVVPRLTDSESMKFALLRYQKLLKEKFGESIARNISVLPAFSEENISEEELQALSRDSRVTDIVNTLLQHAVVQHASDIHMEPGEKDLHIRYRIGGKLHEAMILPRNIYPALLARIKFLAGLSLERNLAPQDGRFTIESLGEHIASRASLVPTLFGEKAVLRLVQTHTNGFIFESLGFHGGGLEHLHHALKSDSGMILASGPLSSGKTTTMYTMLDLCNRPGISIGSIEDPIEYPLKRVYQTQVREEMGLSMASGLRAILRQDSDIVMIGELRDEETANLSAYASIHRHMVVASVEALSAAEGIQRLLQLKVQPEVLSSALRLVIGGRLVRKLKDKEKYFLTKAELETLDKKVNLKKVLVALKEEKVVGRNAVWEEIPFWKPKGGYVGLIGLQEVLPVTTGIKEIILKSGTAADIQKQAEKEGMLTVSEDGIFKCVRGLTTLEEVLKVALD